MAKAKKYLLLNEGYDSLQCPHCWKLCYPDAKASDGTIIYSRHKCDSGGFDPQFYRFEINIDGELVE